MIVVKVEVGLSGGGLMNGFLFKFSIGFGGGWGLVLEGGMGILMMMCFGWFEVFLSLV